MKKQCGRSMTEMIGVLAVVGVLSIAALMGFSYAMNKQKASNLAKDIFQLAFVLESSGIVRNAPLNEIRQLPASVYYPETDVALLYQRTSAARFNIFAQAVAEKVCYHMLNYKISSAILIQVNGAEFTNEAQCVASNQIVYAFTIPMKEKEDETRQPCDGACYGCLKCDEVSDTCVEDNSRCSNGFLCINARCVCPDGQEDIGGACRMCSDTGNWSVSEIECDKCPDRSWFNGTCYPSCEIGSFRNDAGVCRACNTSMFRVSTTQAECNRCSSTQRTFEVAASGIGYCRKNCSGDNPIAGDTECTSCSATKNYISVLSKSECDKCGSDWFYRFNQSDQKGYCYRPCAEGEVRSSNGACEVCGTQMNYVTEEGCATCPSNTSYWDHQYTSCRMCTDGATRRSTVEECHRCNDRFHSVDVCLLCTNTGHYSTSAEECSRCSNRNYVGTRCFPPCSEGDGYIRSTDANCYACSVSAVIKTSAAECAKCENRVLVNDKCLLSLVDCPAEQFMNDEAVCRDCSATKQNGSASWRWTSSTTAAECAKCPARSYDESSAHCYVTCDASKPLANKNHNTCLPCDTTVTVGFLSKEICDRCPNREWVGTDCRLKS